jgi:sulfate transport system ATP-binding protein
MRLFVRPHDLALVDDGGLPARVLAVHRRADRITVELAAERQERLLELDLPASPDTVPPRPGQAVGVQALRYRVYPA